MNRTPEAEQKIKLTIRDIVGRNPLISVSALQQELKERGFETLGGNPLHWHYLAKLVRKLNREKAMSVDTQKINECLAITKERYRLAIERLWRIIDYKIEYMTEYILPPPKPAEVVKAIDTLVKLDLAILKAEMDAGIFDRKLGSVDVNVFRGREIDPEKATLIAGAFKDWGIILDIPTQRPKVIEQLPPPNGDASAPLG